MLKFQHHPLTISLLCLLLIALLNGQAASAQATDSYEAAVAARQQPAAAPPSPTSTGHVQNRANRAPPIRAGGNVFLVDHNGDQSGQPCTGNDGDCSLRSAIERANLSSDVDMILFNGPYNIVPQSALPDLATPMTLYGGGLFGDLEVRVDARFVDDLLHVTGDDVTIDSMTLYRSANEAFFKYLIRVDDAEDVILRNNILGVTGISAPCHERLINGVLLKYLTTPTEPSAWVYGNTIRCTYWGVTTEGGSLMRIGVDEFGNGGPDQRNRMSENTYGVVVGPWSHEVLVQNNEIINNDLGVLVKWSDGAQISANTIAGNSATGLGLLNYGIYIDESNDVIIGCPLADPIDAALGNSIDGNGKDGIVIGAFANGFFEPSRNTQIGCNAIGVNEGNGLSGVRVFRGSSGVQIGNHLPAAANIIVGNAEDGIFFDAAGSNNKIGRNYVGVLDSLAPLPNGRYGIYVENTPEAAIGAGLCDPYLEHCLEVASNTLDGVMLNGADDAFVGRLLLAYRNQRGIVINDSSDVIVWPSWVFDNKLSVSSSSGMGIVVAGDSQRVTVLPLMINNNDGPPIDLDNDGVSWNDLNDVDSGPNTLLNYPEVTNVAGTTLTGVACYPCSVDVYERHGDVADGGGGTYKTTVNAVPGGGWIVDLAPHGLTPETVTLVARTSDGHTSEMRPLSSVPTAVSIATLAAGGAPQHAGPLAAAVLLLLVSGAVWQRSRRAATS